MCAFVLSCGNAILTQKLKGSNGDRGEMVLKATVPTSEITKQKSYTNTFVPANLMINLQDFKSIKLRHVADLFGNLSS